MDQSDKIRSERFTKGWQKLKEIDGKGGENVVDSLRDISPDLGTYIVEFCFGDIYSRKGLDLKAKEIVVVAALVAVGTAKPQLKVHLNGALNTGSFINELKEVILQISVYAGFPSAINGMAALKEVLDERIQEGITDLPGKLNTTIIAPDRLSLGRHELARLDVHQNATLQEAFGDFSPDLIRFTIEYGYGDVFSRNNLDIRYKQLATIAALTSLGNAIPQLKFHIRGALNIGVTADEIKELMLLMTVFAGFPSAINGTNALKEVLTETAESLYSI